MKMSIFARLVGRATGRRSDSVDPIRAELFSVERLEQHAESLAAAQRIVRRSGAGRPLAPRLRDNSRVLLAAYRAIGQAVQDEQAITPAAEWLLDNFHIIEEQIREIRDDLPRGYYRQLPKLAVGSLAGFPRVFGIAWAYVAHTDSHVDPDVLCRFVRAYQRVQPLTIGELWAVAITLRIVLVENLRRAAERIDDGRNQRQRADELADRILGVSGAAANEHDVEPIEILLRRIQQDRLPRSFAVQLTQRLRDQDPSVTPALHWLDERLAAQGTTADEIVSEELQLQGASNVTVRNVITSMHLISTVDWTEFFESVSLVDETLRAGSDFAAMDFQTRDQYRHVIEELARNSRHTELEVARAALSLAGAASNGDDMLDEPERDTGFYLIGKGRVSFERLLDYRLPLKTRLIRQVEAAGIFGYAVAIGVLLAVLVGVPLALMAHFDVPRITIALLGLLALVPASDAAVALANRLVTRCLGAMRLPALELSDGVPTELRTLVVVPTLLTSPSDVEMQIERLEVRQLASASGDIRFALLSDWVDADTESAPGDDALLALAAAGIAQLNRRHAEAPDGDRFLLLHRRRTWNAREGKWIGWERKRGKLHELNRLLRGAGDTTFLPVDGRPPVVPANVRYVITLDADTQLPRDAALRLIGKMAHPLNRPRFDVDTGRVMEGYGLLQPRVTPTLPTGHEGSLFQRVFSGPSGLDPYAFAVSDVYQDLLGEGSYTGKGIYDVDAFAAALAGRVPENSLLSHDLFEGTFARAGLVSDVEVVEEFPARYDVAASRQHRWARGDWQLLPWILGRGRNEGGERGGVSIPGIGRWKMLDNLRRTLSAPTTWLALVAGWMLPVAAATAWTAAILVLVALPPLVPLVSGILPRRRGISKRSHVRGLGTDTALALSQIGLQLAFVAHQAWLMTDAIVRTLYRLYVSHRHMLEWLTAAQSKGGLSLDLIGFYRRMAGGVALAVIAAVLVGWSNIGVWYLSAPFVLLWIAGPALAQYASRPPPIVGPTAIGVADAVALRRVARRTWRFFEAFVVTGDHMLPPDNFQEEPKRVVAHRTSPTNIGLYLLSVIAARDFGWIGTQAAVERIEDTLRTMGRLERLRGHFYNWYDTQDLRPLDPRYISSVDSGNLAGHLLALAVACRQMSRAPVVNLRWHAGIEDAVGLTRAATAGRADDRRAQTVTHAQLHDALDTLVSSLRSAPDTPTAMAQQMMDLVLQGDIVVDIAQTLTEAQGDGGDTELLTWATAARRSIGCHARDFDDLMPWASRFFQDVVDRLAPDVDDRTSHRATLAQCFATVPTLIELPDRCAVAVDALTHIREQVVSQADGGVVELAEIATLIAAFERSARAAGVLERRLAALAESAERFFAEMNFTFLLDPTRHLLSIGYQVVEGRLDPSCYDLLASEARLASFVAIAKGDAPVRHWSRLGRSLTPVDRGSALLSWSGSMFEYLMPGLVMRAPTGSLLEQTNRLVVRRQIRYGAELGVPWGVSESAYNVRDVHFTYQYSNFGVPGLGLKRGLNADAVISPYATALAAMVDGPAATRNFARLETVGAKGAYGFYEALDYTPTRLPEGKDVAIVHAYMAHHQGMTIVALANALHGGAMRSRFHSQPIIQATELLLQERTPRDVAVARPRAEEVKGAANVREMIPSTLRRHHSPHDFVPRTHLLSNGSYAVMLTAAGSGYSRWRDLDVTRWREDVSSDGWGSYIYLRNLDSGKMWSAGYQPSGVEPDSYEVEFTEGRAAITRRDETIQTVLEVVVSGEDDAEVRHVSITNFGARSQRIELTSYAEVVLAPAAADAAHPAFSNLFVATEFVAEAGGVLLATRRRRSPDEAEVWAGHLVVVQGESLGTVEYETDRTRFLGRERDIRSAIAMQGGQKLSGTVGTVLDPIFSLRRSIRVAPGATAHVAFWTVAAPSRREALDLADRHHDVTAFERALTLAWTQAHVQLHHIGCTPEEAYLFQRLANHVIYANPTLRPHSAVLQRNELSQSGLWAHGISGDLPIVLVRIDEVEDLEIVRQMLRAHQYWRTKRLAVDLVIVNERPASYAQDLSAAVETLVRKSHSRTRTEYGGTRGGVVVLRVDQVPLPIRTLLQATARAVILGSRGSISEQLKLREDRQSNESAVSATAHPRTSLSILRSQGGRGVIGVTAAAQPERPPLEFFNGLGGFTKDGREYVTILGEGQSTPAPWLNVIANPTFGFQVSTVGSGYTWSINSRQYQLTPWSNDPVGDRPGEVFYLRDEDSGTLWCPTAAPIRDHASVYLAAHGQGYSRFEHNAHGIDVELLQFVPRADSIKISRLKIHNHSNQVRRLSVTAYVEWVLGSSRAAAAPFLVTEIDPATGAMLARNPWTLEFGNRIAFADLAGKQKSWTGDRMEFLGRNGSLARPSALAPRGVLSNRTGAGLDPCGALQAPILLEPNGTVEVVFLLGEAATRTDAGALIERYRNIDLDDVLREATGEWDDILGTVQVTTPNRAMDLLINRWLLYQTLACRVFARSAFYQASGAYGFRDQLQDLMALTVARPALTREHLLRASGRQFVEGDVQHWWMPPSGQGVRTRISDDRVWLAYAAAQYVVASGDNGVLDESVPFLEGPSVRPGEHDAYYQPMVGEEEATLFEHCARGLDAALSVGVHGLPLICGGDWNDGMNRVGEGGKGESVWLAWLLHATLGAFVPLAESRGEMQRAAVWKQHAVDLRASLERHAWDGNWYRRGFYDDGTALGSAASDECHIDSIAQSWAVISGAAGPERAARAMASVDEHLVRRADGLVLLFTPPFADTALDPGYIKGYPPGIRENGGQYTHAAAWSVIAFALLGEGDTAEELFALLNPIHHAQTRAASHRYKVEPYVTSADVYSQPPHVGRGGWTWYTGSAGWLYRAGLEWILGFRVEGTTLFIDPCVPKAWPGFEIAFRFRSALYEISVTNPDGVSRGVNRVELDDAVLSGSPARIDLVDDGATHYVRVRLGATS